MGQALYRKYRSKNFGEVVGQDHITKTLDEALKNGRISHAYLFTGPRGIGKTSVARILAHEVNKLPYQENTVHLDIIEIDAASNRRIDEIRDLREKVHISPTSAKYKVYIIDEVHMLTREAFNALLKTLEEPPEHCIFILATTEAHKLPETIISRTQRYSFKSVEKEVAAAHLKNIAKKEGIDVSQDALDLIAEHGEGSFRDSISMLDQLQSSSKEITASEVRRLLGIAPEESVANLIASAENGDSAQILALLNELTAQGIDSAKTAKQLGEKLREKLLNEQNDSVWITDLMRQLILVPSSPEPKNYLEISLLEAASTNNKTNYSKPEKDFTAQKPAEKPPKKTAQPHPEKVNKGEVTLIAFNAEAWNQIVNKIKEEAASLYTALRLATPQMSDDELVLFFQFPLHQKKVNQQKHLHIIGDAVEQVTGKNVSIRCVVDKNIKPKPTPVPETETINVSKNMDDVKIGMINNIFGTAEVLES